MQISCLSEIFGKTVCRASGFELKLEVDGYPASSWGLSTQQPGRYRRFGHRELEINPSKVEFLSVIS